MPSRANLAFVFALLGPAAVAAVPDADAQLEQQFKTAVHPFLQSYCLPCHGAEKQEAELDLSSFTSVEKVVAGAGHWGLVLERLEAGDMPSEKAKKFPTEREREAIVAWIHALRKNEGTKNAGDPGVVLARRLSNAEYDYTIRDLTGVDLRPTKEFPVDPANQAGFDNSGESLAMSPALLKKYFGAARTIADHLVLTPDGFEFAPHPVVADTDRDKYFVLKIVEFYKRQPTDLADYFAAAWRYRHRAALGRPAGSVADIAAEAKVSANYLATVTALLNDQADDLGPLAKLRAMWHALPAPGGPADASLVAVREGAAQMRDYVTGVREKIVPVVKNLTVPSIQNGSQTMVMWKNREMAANRRKFDPAALHYPGQPVAMTEEKKPAMAAAGATTDAYAQAKPAAAENLQAVVNQVGDRKEAQASPPAPANTAAGATAVTPPAAPTTTANGTASLLQSADAKPNSEIIQRGGTFLAPAITTTGSSATFKMAALKNRGADPDLAVPADPAERTKHEAAFSRFADVFPDAFYITERARVYLDAEKEQKLAGRLLSAGLHSMTGYFRDDRPLYDLVLDDAGRRELDRLWAEFDFCAAIPVRMHTSFVWFERTDSSYLRDPEFDPYRPEDKSVTTQEKIAKLGELYLAKATRAGASETAQAAIKDHFAWTATRNRWLDDARAAAVRPHLQALERFAARAYRRPLTARERDDIAAFYKVSREENGLEHEDAMRDGIVRVLMSPHFCYRVDLVEAAGERRASAGAGGARVHVAAYPGGAAAATATSLRADVKPLSDYALASRLSYFLWSSMPDDALLARAAAGELQRPEVLAAEARRMLQDPRARNFATEFAGHWLDFRRFEEHNAVDRERFPTFTNELRAAMFEEPLRFFRDVVAHDRSVLNFLYGDYTFVNGVLAQHYGMPAPAGGADAWARVERAGEFGRGGLLPMAVFLTANSPGLRTSPVKRGYWVVRRVLGERIPPPPAVVPDLPNDERNLGGLTLRETLAKHREDKSCASCHARFDSFGLVFEGFGPVGERRTKDFGGRAVDTRAPFPGGSEGNGLPGLRDYIRAHRENDFVDNLARKLLAYALGRSLLLSDDSLLAEMKARLVANDHRFGALVETIVTSPQFRTKRAATAAVVAAPVKTAANN